MSENVVEFVKEKMAESMPSIRKCPLCGVDHRSYKRASACMVRTKALKHKALIMRMYDYIKERFL